MIAETTSMIAAMCLQEENAYRTHDYLQSSTQTKDIAIDRAFRSQMCDWCDQVVEYCQMSHTTVEIAMSYVDRFCSTNEGASCGALNDRNTFQLAFMTALYTAIKIHEPVCVDPLLISKLSQGLYNTKEIEAMESFMLTSLKWRMNTPTTAVFLYLFLKLFPDLSSNPTLRVMIHDLATAQIQSVISDYAYVTAKASTIAYFSLINALESLHILRYDVIASTMTDLAKVIGLKVNDYSKDNAKLQNHLNEMLPLDQKIPVKIQSQLVSGQRTEDLSSETRSATNDTVCRSISSFNSPCQVIAVSQH